VPAGASVQFNGGLTPSVGELQLYASESADVIFGLKMRRPLEVVGEGPPTGRLENGVITGGGGGGVSVIIS
jgi:hypothetical protein